MKNWLPYLFTFIGGFAAAWLVASAGKVTSAEHEAALGALRRARDTVIQTTTYVTRIDTVRVRQLRVRVDTMAVTDTLMMGHVVRDTVVVLDTTGIEWEFGDSTAAYTLWGRSYANLRRPGLSFTSYTLDVHEAAICPRLYRLTLGGGVYAGVPFIAGNVRVSSRLWLGAMAGAVSDAGKVEPRYGASAAWAVF